MCSYQQVRLVDIQRLLHLKLPLALQSMLGRPVQHRSHVVPDVPKLSFVGRYQMPESREHVRINCCHLIFDQRRSLIRLISLTGLQAARSQTGSCTSSQAAAGSSHLSLGAQSVNEPGSFPFQNPTVIRLIAEY